MPTPLNDNGPRIVFMRGGIYPCDKYNFTDIGLAMAAMQDIIMREDDYALINGVVFVMDSEKASLAHFMQMTPKLMKTYTVYSEEAIPLRPKANHMINTLPALEPLFNLFKPMMSKKQQERVNCFWPNVPNLLLNNENIFFLVLYTWGKLGIFIQKYTEKVLACRIWW